MSFRWLRLLCLLGLCGTALGSRAQETTTYSRPAEPWADPVFLLNSTIIINGVLGEFTVQDNHEIRGVNVYKGPKAPGHLQNLSPNEIINLNSPKRIRSRSFARLGRQLGLRGPLVFALNGHPLDPAAVAALRIAPASIGQIHIVRPTPGQLATSVDIWLTPVPKPKHPPGTIMIR